ncbi:MAG: hypothetical protein JXP34_12615 [Planctomycetes bacterium]|nr:hypothetical protein [Planctomycetota bacterium]
MTRILRLLLVLGVSALLFGPVASQTGATGGGVVHLDLPNADQSPDDVEEDVPEVILFYDNPYEGDCFVFCCDRSSSMNHSYRGRVKIQQLKEELIRAVNQMSSDGEASMVFFDAGMLIFSEQPIPMDPAGKQRAIAWVMSVTPGRGTCLAPAGVKSLAIASRSSKRYRTIVILTDGMPWCNGALTTRECLRDITAANVQRIPINTVALPDESEGEWDPEFLQQLAAMNKGSFRVVGS